MSQDVEPKSSKQETILPDTSVVTDASMTNQDSESEAEELNPQNVFNEWIMGLKKSDRKIIATCLFMSFLKWQRMNVMAAAQEAASITG